MNKPLSHPLTWSDVQLTEAIHTSTNWHSVMRMLGYGERSKSAGAIRIVRRRAAELDLDTSHFRGKRRWTDPQLRQAVTEAHSWEEVLTTLGLSTRGGSMQPHIKAHTIRLGLDTAHLNRLSHRGPGPSQAPPEMAELQADLGTRQRTDDVEQQPRRQDDYALARHLGFHGHAQAHVHVGGPKHAAV